jgi:hypothetical protein
VQRLSQECIDSLILMSVTAAVNSALPPNPWSHPLSTLGSTAGRDCLYYCKLSAGRPV